nr:hypothetical protein [Burkholderia gladioli]
MAVAETTTAEGKSASGEARRVKRSSGMRAAAVLAASVVAGALSTPVQAQIVGAGPSAPTVIQTPNGLPQLGSRCRADRRAQDRAAGQWCVEY